MKTTTAHHPTLVKAIFQRTQTTLAATAHSPSLPSNRPSSRSRSLTWTSRRSRRDSKDSATSPVAALSATDRSTASRAKPERLRTLLAAHTSRKRWYSASNRRKLTVRVRRANMVQRMFSAIQQLSGLDAIGIDLGGNGTLQKIDRDNQTAVVFVPQEDAFGPRQRPPHYGDPLPLP